MDVGKKGGCGEKEKGMGRVMSGMWSSCFTQMAGTPCGFRPVALLKAEFGVDEPCAVLRAGNGKETQSENQRLRIKGRVDIVH